jgi:hypothetical protein
MNGATELDRLLFLGTIRGFLLTSFLMSAANVFGPMLLLVVVGFCCLFATANGFANTPALTFLS